jgi:glycosyltransferase involved in cell wall biosynthesis
LKYTDWLPQNWQEMSLNGRLDRKRREIALADLVLVPSTFVMHSIQEYAPEKEIVLVPYGVDLEFWTPPGREAVREDIRFVYAGGVSVRKGIPLLLEAWRCAALSNASLTLAGNWELAEKKREDLPAGVNFIGPCSRTQLRQVYRESDVFVFPSFSEGFGLVILEALACGVPVIASRATAGADVLDDACGRLYNPDEQDELVEVLRWFSASKMQLARMKKAARRRAEQFTWANYRRAVQTACAAYI